MNSNGLLIIILSLLLVVFLILLFTNEIKAFIKKVSTEPCNFRISIAELGEIKEVFILNPKTKSIIKKDVSNIFISLSEFNIKLKLTFNCNFGYNNDKEINMCFGHSEITQAFEYYNIYLTKDDAEHARNTIIRNEMEELSQMIK